MTHSIFDDPASAHPFIVIGALVFLIWLYWDLFHR